MLNKQYDACVTWTSGQGEKSEGYSRGNLRAMVDRSMLNMSDVNIIWQSGKIPNGPWAVRTALPASLKKDFTDFLLDLPKSHQGRLRRRSSRAPASAMCRRRWISTRTSSSCVRPSAAAGATDAWRRAGVSHRTDRPRPSPDDPIAQTTIRPTGCSSSASARCGGRGTENAADLRHRHAAVFGFGGLDRFLPDRSAARRAPHRRIFRQAVLDRTKARRRSGGRPGLGASVRRREGTAVRRLLVLPDRRLRGAAVADDPDGDPGDACSALARAFVLSFPGRAHARQQPHGGRSSPAACWNSCAPSRRSCWRSSWSGRSASARWPASSRSPSTPPARWESCSSN